MTRTTKGTLLASVRGRRSIEAIRAARRSVKRGRTTLGALAFRALARALAWLALLGRAGLLHRPGNRAGLRPGLRRAGLAGRRRGLLRPGTARRRRLGRGAPSLPRRAVACTPDGHCRRGVSARAWSSSVALPVRVMASPRAAAVAGPAIARRRCGGYVRSRRHRRVRRRASTTGIAAHGRAAPSGDPSACAPRPRRRTARLTIRSSSDW